MPLIFLKLGGSLITDKDKPYTARTETIDRLSQEIAQALSSQPDLRLILGHGSGSFGHTAAKKYGTRQGVSTPEQWRGFVEVWKEARALNEIVLQSLLNAGIPVMAFPPSAAVTARDGTVARWDIAPIQAALDHGIVPLVNGDTIFDEQRGGTILSTEDLFFYLAQQLKPQKVLLAGIEEGVWEDFPACTRLIAAITPQTFRLIGASIGGSASVDVTGGMQQKVESMLSLVGQIRGFSAQIFSGEQPGQVRRALQGDFFGTRINA